MHIELHRQGAGDSCISPSAATSLWATYLQPLKSLKPLMYLGSPCITNSGSANMGLSWLRAFLSTCSSCTIDFICIHWYDSATNAAYFKTYINQVRQVAQGRPIWITEFAATGSETQVKAFLDEVIPWMDASADVQRYAYFMARENLLVSSDGTGMSELGKYFVFWR